MSDQGYPERLVEFFCAPSRGSAAALFRLGFGSVAIWSAFEELLNVERFYTDDGLVPWSVVEPSGQLLSIFALAPHDRTLPWLIVGLSLLAAIAFTLGWWPRVWALMIFVLNLALQHRNPFLCNTGDCLFLILAALAPILPLGHRFSIDSWLRQRRGLAAPSGTVWGQRLIALQIAYVYMSTFVAKFRHEQWQDGTALHEVLASPVWSHWPIDVHFTPLIQLLTWSTLVFEVSFPLLVWFPQQRRYLLAAGILFHLGIQLTLSVHIFSAVMIASYACFLSDDEAEWLVRKLGRLSGRLNPLKKRARKRDRSRTAQPTDGRADEEGGSRERQHERARPVALLRAAPAAGDAVPRPGRARAK